MRTQARERVSAMAKNSYVQPKLGDEKSEPNANDDSPNCPYLPRKKKERDKSWHFKVLHTSRCNERAAEREIEQSLKCSVLCVQMKHLKSSEILLMRKMYTICKSYGALFAAIMRTLFIFFFILFSAAAVITNGRARQPH